jgi:branched-chain amino acid transport system permease protein
MESSVSMLRARLEIGLGHLMSRRTVLVAAIILLLALPLEANPYVLYIANIGFIYVLLSAGLNILIGYTGQLAFANAALFGIGAYTTGLLQVRLGVPYWSAAPCGVVAATIVGVIIAFPALRLKRLYLSLASLAFAYSSLWVFMNWEPVTFGAGGFRVPAIDFSPLPVSRPIAVYYMSFAVMVALVALLWNLLRSRVGRAFVAVRESEVAAAALGINPTKYKTIAFGISAFSAGLAGALFETLLRIVTPESFDVFNIVLQFCMVVVGGLGSLWGSIIGAGLLIVVDEVIRAFRNLEEMTFGCIILLSVLFMRSGLIALIKAKLRGWEEPLRRIEEDR